MASKLALPSVEDAECIVAKAIRDGGVDAVLDHDAGVMMSKETQVGLLNTYVPNHCIECDLICLYKGPY